MAKFSKGFFISRTLQNLITNEPMHNPFQVTVADLADPDQGAAIISLLNSYAIDVMGGGQPLTDFVRKNLISELQNRPDCVVVVVMADSNAVAMAICFEGFSTFACRPILNIHDLMVAETHRRQGLSRLLLEKVEEIAKNRNCCKITLEVLEGNQRARSIYQTFGFETYGLNAAMGAAIFCEKKL